MLILYNSLLKKKSLVNIAKINNIKNYSNLNKIKLLYFINKHKAIIYIQRIIRNYLNNELICPITLCELNYPFISIKNNNKFNYYNLLAFIEYINKSKNDFRDPLTREPLTENSLKQIENLIKYYKIKKNYNKKSWEKKINIRAEYLTITNCLNQIITDIFTVKTLNFNYIYNNILPQFIYYFHFLLQRHKNNCFSVINNYINCINHHKCDNKIYLVEYLKLIINVNNL